MAKVTFSKVSLADSKYVECAGGCGRKLRRKKTFYQTLNPFNLNKDGEKKTRAEIYAELREEIAEWKNQPETCRDCRV